MDLLSHAGNGGPAHCVHCGALAVGPCARCDAPVCGDCCTLTEGTTKPYAICLGCAERGGRSLKSAWWVVIGWLLRPIAALAALLALLWILFGR
jgi:hypothetical protein